jgi:hypothetical protein
MNNLKPPQIAFILFTFVVLFPSLVLLPGWFVLVGRFFAQ